MTLSLSQKAVSCASVAGFLLMMLLFFLIFDPGPDYLLILGEWRGWQIRCRQQLPVILEMKGLLRRGWGSRSCFSCSSLKGSGHVSHTTCLSKKSLSYVQRRSVNPKEYKGERERNTWSMCLILQSVLEREACSYLFHPFPWAHPNCLSFSSRYLCQTALLHICCKTTPGIYILQHRRWCVIVECTPDQNPNDLGYGPGPVMD